MEQTVRKPELTIDNEIRRYYDTVTWLAEVLPGSMRTPFEYSFDGHELYASDGSPLEPIFDDAIEDAKKLPAYEQRRREIEKEEYFDLLAMARGELPNTMVVVSDFPPELMSATEDVGGYNVARKQTMLRIFSRTEQGGIRMVSQSLDQSNRYALEAMYWDMGFVPAKGELLPQRMHITMSVEQQEFLADRLTGVYDRSLPTLDGVEWYAGRNDRMRADTFDFVKKQTDLINAYLATTESFTGGIQDLRLAAAMRDRYMGKSRSFVIEPNSLERSFELPVAAHALALQEMELAGQNALQKGETFSGCGSTVSGTSASDHLAEAGIGNKADKKLSDDKYGSRYFNCPKCKKENTRKVRNELLTHCQKCNLKIPSC